VGDSDETVVALWQPVRRGLDAGTVAEGIPAERFQLKPQLLHRIKEIAAAGSERKLQIGGFKRQRGVPAFPPSHDHATRG
jgi:hypothetical protein